MTTKIKTGRPTKYDPKYCEMIVEFMADGSSMTAFASHIDVARSTINEWADKNPEFSEAVKRAKAKCATWWEQLARKGAMGEQVNHTLIIFGLKNMSPEEWKDRREVDNISSDGSMSQPKQIQIIAPAHVDKAD